MINSECKKSLLKMVDKIAENKSFWQKIMENKGRNREGKLGSSNIRSVANICENADCFEELKLYIQYKIAKGNGWNEKFDNQMTFGEVVLRDMDKIYEDTQKENGIANVDEEAIKRIGLYFGYLYWTKTSIEKGSLGGRNYEFAK